MKKFKRHSAVNEAKVIEVIAIESIVGEGVEGDPIRPVREYFSKDGVLLARASSIEDLHTGSWVSDTDDQTK